MNIPDDVIRQQTERFPLERGQQAEKHPGTLAPVCLLPGEKGHGVADLGLAGGAPPAMLLQSRHQVAEHHAAQLLHAVRILLQREIRLRLLSLQSAFPSSGADKRLNDTTFSLTRMKTH